MLRGKGFVPMENPRAFGEGLEVRASEILVKNWGYSLVRRNFRHPLAQIDLWMKNKDGIDVLCEVKTLSEFTDPQQRISHKQRQRLLRAQQALNLTFEKCFLLELVLIDIKKNKLEVFDMNQW